MAARRTQKKWQVKIRKYWEKFRFNPSSYLLFFLILLSVLSSWKNSQQSPYALTKVIENNNPVKSFQDRDVKIGSIEQIKNINYASVDSHAFSIQYYGHSVSELASLLSRHANTEAEKARIIYSWITNNIAYDVSEYLSGNYEYLSPEGVLRKRKALCSGYANLYKALAEAMGLDAKIVDGYSKGASYAVGDSTEINHAWNAVKINNGWYLVDVTWGAGTLDGTSFNKNFNPHYFATPPDQFIYDHFPRKAMWQLLSQPYSKQQFELLPEVSPQFFRDKLRFVSHNNHTISANGRVEIILEVPKDIVASSRLKYGSNYLEDSYTFVQTKDGKIFANAAFPLPGTYELQIFSKKRYEQGAYFHTVTYKILSNSTGEEFPATYSHFSENNAYIYTPLKKYLSSNGSVYFKLDVPNALEVQAIDRASNNWTQLTRSGTVFEGNVLVGSGKINIVAKFPGDERYWSLAEYN